MAATQRTSAARLRLVRGEAGASSAPSESRTRKALRKSGVTATAEPAEEQTPKPPQPEPEGGRLPRSHESYDLADASLVALAIQGDSRAGEQLYRRHASFAFNLAARIAGSTRDVEDVVHDAFLKALSELATLRSPQAFRWWLGSIVVRGMRTRLRRGRWLRLFGLGRPHDPIDLESIAAEDAPPSARAELAQIYALLQTLEPDDRIAWTLRFVEGRELNEAADLAGCSLATVKRRIGRAQRFLQDHFVDTGSDEDDEESST